jgi:hypothetical protein
MDDEPSSAWLIYLIGIWVLAGVAFIVLGTGMARAQELLCVPGDALIRQTMEVKKEHPVWDGTIPVEGQPPAEAVLTQSEKGGWSFFLIQNGNACLLFAGTDANPPINPGKGA